MIFCVFYRIKFYDSARSVAYSSIYNMLLFGSYDPFMIDGFHSLFRSLNEPNPIEIVDVVRRAEILKQFVYRTQIALCITTAATATSSFHASLHR